MEPGPIRPGIGERLRAGGHGVDNKRGIEPIQPAAATACRQSYRPNGPDAANRSKSFRPNGSGTANRNKPHNPNGTGAAACTKHPAAAAQTGNGNYAHIGYRSLNTRTVTGATGSATAIRSATPCNTPGVRIRIRHSQCPKYNT